MLILILLELLSLSGPVLLPHLEWKNSLPLQRQWALGSQGPADKGPEVSAFGFRSCWFEGMGPCLVTCEPAGVTWNRPRPLVSPFVLLPSVATLNKSPFLLTTVPRLFN